MRPFLEELATRVLVSDGAMGTMLYAKGVFVNRSFDELNELCYALSKSSSVASGVMPHAEGVSTEPRDA
jgi:methionine synthase I (cobalamin-dependent)